MIEIAGRPVSDSHPCFVIAEIGVNHNGCIETAHRLIEAAADSGADAVKFQTFRADDLVAENTPTASYQNENCGAQNQNDMLKALELTAAQFIELQQTAQARGLIFLSTAFDEPSLQTITQMGVPAIKWPSGELTNWPLLAKAIEYGRPIILSTGMASLSEVEATLAFVDHRVPLVILQCVSDYPAPLEDQNFRTLDGFKSMFNLDVGFSDHTLGVEGAIIARAKGMCVWEKHLTLSRDLPGPDHKASTEPAEFKAMVEIIRRVELSLGDGVKAPNTRELETRELVRKSLYFRHSLPAGHNVSIDDFVAKRPGDGLPPTQVESIVGSVLKRTVQANERVTLSDFRHD